MYASKSFEARLYCYTTRARVHSILQSDNMMGAVECSGLSRVISCQHMCPSRGTRYLAAALPTVARRSHHVPALHLSVTPLPVPRGPSVVRAAGRQLRPGGVTAPTRARARHFGTASATASAQPGHDGGAVHGLWLAYPDRALFYPASWLRDHCRCPACLYEGTQQRQADTLAEALQDGMTVKSAQVQGGDGASGLGGVLSVSFSSGHVGSFPLNWLLRHEVVVTRVEQGHGQRQGQMQVVRQHSASEAPEGGMGAQVSHASVHPSPRSPHSSPVPSSVPARPPYAQVDEDPALDTRGQVLWSRDVFAGRRAGADKAAVGSNGNTDPAADLPDDARGWPSVPARAFLQDDTVLLGALQLLRDWGFVRIEGLEPTMEATQEACRRIGPPRPTLYSGDGFWRTEIRPDPSAVNDTAYTTLALEAHTDGNYLQDTPGLQAFHALQADPTGGGRTLLIDGFAAAALLLNTHRWAYSYLTRALLPFHHTDPENVVWAWKQVLVPRLDARDQGLRTRAPHVGTVPGPSPLSSVHFNADDRAPYTGHPAASRAGDRIRVMVAPNSASSSSPLLSPGSVLPRDLSQAGREVVELYSHIGAWRAKLMDPAMRVWCTLRPGTLLVFDNRRVLHGRSAVHPASGRVLAGCYHRTEDWHSKLRALTHRLQGTK